ncbi:hypothetical protein [Sporosarcina sp. D27]|uniref:hypothetical protein n=1 Tax=Sporosarcina sp. D27 TaxID=1382305 RepID=UPI0004714734|nr:hypothetical protein [Sporosarcina sp. D27]
MSWLLIGVLISSVLLFNSTHSKNWMSRRRAVMNTLLIVNGFLLGYGTLLATNLERPYSTSLSIIGYLLVLCAIICIYRTSLRHEMPTNAKLLHALNITIGIVLTLGTLYFIYIFFLFSEDGNGEVWKLFVPLVLYGIAYAIQMRALGAQRKSFVYTVAVVQILMPVVLLLIWMVVPGEGGL